MNEKKSIIEPWMFFILLIVVVIAAVAYTLPLGLNGEQDIFFTVSVENNVWTNNPTITNVDVYAKPSTLVNTNYALASFYKSGNLELETRVGTEIYRKNIGELARVDVDIPLTTGSERTVSYRVPGVREETKTFTIRLLEDGTEIDKWEGKIP